MNEGLMSFKTQSFMYLLKQTTAPASFCPKKLQELLQQKIKKKVQQTSLQT
jgi:hypothetical protein